MKTRLMVLALLSTAIMLLGWLGTTPPVSRAAALYAEDCLSYNPNDLYIVDEGGVWLLTDGTSRMKQFANQADAELGLQVAKLYTQHCFIGRGNSRPNRSDYIFEYWKGSSGLSGSLPTNDCLAHDRDALYIVDEGANGWLLTDGVSRMVMFDNQDDAQAGLDLVRQYDRICYIGRGTGYIMTYLYADVFLVDPGLIVPIDPGVIIPIDPGALPGSLPAEDCIPYDPDALFIQDQGANGWLLTDGSMAMRLYDTEADANLGLQVARAHTAQCFVGRGNSRPDRYRYIWEYWKGDSGLGIVLPDDDCLDHDPAVLTVEDQGADGWLITANGEAIKQFDTQGDALFALEIMNDYDQHCYIGRGNSRPDRLRYVAEYLRHSAVLGPPPIPAGEDCLSYDPYGLVISDEGATGWILTDGSSNMLLLDNVSDAEAAANVALAHNQQCFIGRDNSRPDRYAYIFEYWKGDSGLGLEPPLHDCIEYNPATLSLTDGGADGWYVVDGPHSIVKLDNMDDANEAKNVMSAYNMICFIGRGNSRAERSRYIHTYLRNAPADVTATPTPTPTPVLTPCASAPPPRMILNHVGRVTFTSGLPSRVRTGPGTNYDILTLVPEGRLFYVTGGPVCGDPFWWWSVQTSTGVNGWMAEGVVGEYYLEPFSP